MNIYDYLSEEDRKLYDSLTGDGDPKRLELAQRDFLKEFFKYHFDAFVYLLGYRDLGKFHKEQMKRIAKFQHLSDKPIRRLWLWSRGFFKTSLITEAHTLWLIVNNPNIRILIISYSLEVAKKPLGAIRNHFMANNEFRYFFPEFCPKPNKEGKIEFGTTESITVPNRTKQSKEPTVMCVGVGTNITGLHFDVHKIDDLVTQGSVTNDTQIQASKDYYSLLKPIFDNPVKPREDICGTIYHFNDLNCSFMDNPAFEKSFIPAKDDNENFMFPERLNKEGWEKLCTDPNMNPYDIQRQWLLRPINPKDAKFKEEWIKWYETLPSVAEYICVDPASTQKKKSDYTVIERWGISWEGKHYLIEGIRDKLTVFQRIDKIIAMAKRCNRLVEIKYEVLGGRHGDLEALKKKCLEEKIYTVPKETKSSTSSKADRIEQRLVGPYHAGAIYLPQSLIYKSEYDNKTHDFVQELKLEYLQFPFTEHDDILDCQSQMFEEPLQMTKGEKPKKEDNKDWGTADDWEEYYKKLDKLGGHSGNINSQVFNRLKINQVKRNLRG